MSERLKKLWRLAEAREHAPPPAETWEIAAWVNEGDAGGEVGG
jgi:hypothetical protein